MISVAKVRRLPLTDNTQKSVNSALQTVVSCDATLFIGQNLPRGGMTWKCRKHYTYKSVLPKLQGRRNFASH